MAKILSVSSPMAPNVAVRIFVPSDQEGFGTILSDFLREEAKMKVAAQEVQDNQIPSSIDEVEAMLGQALLGEFAAYLNKQTFH